MIQSIPSQAGPLTPARERILLIFLVAVQFSNVVDFMILMPLGPRLMQSFHITPGQFGGLVSAYTFSAGIFGFLAAPVLDRFTRKAAMLFTFAGFIFGTVFCGFANTYPMLMAGRVLAGAFGGMTASLVMTMVADAIPLHRRGAAMGKVMMSFSMASVLGVPLGIFCANRLGWQAPFRILGAVALAVLLAAAFGLPGLPKAQGSREKISRTLREIFAHPPHWMAFAFTSLLIFSGFTVIPYISPTLVQNGGLTNEQLPYIYMVGGICTLVSMPLLGKLADKRGLFRVFMVLSFLTIIPMFLVTHLGRTTLAHVLPITSFFMVCASGRFAPGFTLVTSAIEARHRGGFLSVNTAFQQIASGLAALVSASMLTSTPGGPIQGYPAVGFVGITALLLSVAVGSRVRPVAVN